MQDSRTIVFGIVLSIAIGASGGLVAADLDIGSEVPPGAASTTNRDVMCLSPYYFGGSSESFAGTDRLRGNIYTFTAADTLTEITVELNFNGTANLYFYVLEAATLAGPFTVVSETLVPSTSVGQSFYSTGEISVPLSAGVYYAIGAAWGPETVTYIRDLATLPRTWALGTVESSAQGSNITPPIGGPVDINAFTGAEYSMTLCFGPVPVELQSLTID